MKKIELLDELIHKEEDDEKYDLLKDIKTDVLMADSINESINEEVMNRMDEINCHRVYTENGILKLYI